MNLVRRVLVVSSIGVLGLVACKKDPPPPDPSPAPSAAGSVSSAPAASASAPSPKTAASKEKKPIPKDARQAYSAGLKKGRAETIAKRYDAAVTGFDAALVALPGDPRALSERGYAKLLGGKTEEARRDFQEALASTKDPKLLAQIHYNLGLVAEKLGKAEEAKVAFTRSNALVPSKAAAAKAGATVCPASLDFAPAPAKLVKDHKGMFDALAAASKATSKVASDAAAKELLVSRVDGENVVSFPREDDTMEWDLHAYVKTNEGYLVATEPASTYWQMPCGGEVHATTQAALPLALVRVEHAPGMRVPVCENDAGELDACGENDEPVQSACGSSDLETTIVVFDTQKKSVVARVSFTGDGKVPKVALVGRKLTVDGAGCAVAHEL